MGLDMYLSSVPKVKTIEEINELEKRLSDAFYKNKLDSEMKKLKKEKDFIYNIPFTLNDYCTKEMYNKYKDDPKELIRKVSLNTREAYWRKFNALHKWFVENVQDGVDECREHIVTFDHLKDLLKTLNEVNRENASEILPTASGFFFGGTDLDDYYFEDVERTKATVIHLLNNVYDRERTLIYCSSW